ncbi:siroheme decarboxylase subunit alpha [Desulfonauticus submarinus]|uniref:siroheme decarboxylase n=1 Tax=Desulfonauticus submarinus TaxID=206665 RepID=A0A1H0FFR9_9BACT|nr:siroheme decarboxylase subunit alpha [Desulfonauticus submarinus]SDN93628.1 transcriptional regulator, AsnC family [Desulfonauticus submarinus]
MDKIDKAILDIIQTDFPLVSRPYAVIGEKLGLEEKEVFNRVIKLKEKGVIRRIGANFQSRKLGWFSTLCAAKVPKEKLEEFVQVVNSYPGVTHNYLRKHDFNVWFTFIGPSEEEVNKNLLEIKEKTGIAVYSLPAIKMFKIKVDFPMQRRNK